MARMDQALVELQRWYHDQCDDDWEHQHGIVIDSLDNPGWWIKIDLTETLLEFKSFERVETDRTAIDWCHCWVEGKKFQAAGGPHNLCEMIQAFLDWKDR